MQDLNLQHFVYKMCYQLCLINQLRKSWILIHRWQVQVITLFGPKHAHEFFCQ